MLDGIIEHYGYWAVFIGAMVEGESIILTASALAALRHFSILRVGIATFAGTLLADQLVYFFGLAYGTQTLSYLCRRFPLWKIHVEKGLSFLKRHETLYILSFRFIYGIRIISPFIIGAQKVPFIRFAVLNVVAAFIWTFISCCIGYFLGTVLGQFTHNIGLIIAGILVGIFGLTWLIARRKKS